MVRGRTQDSPQPQIVEDVPREATLAIAQAYRRLHKGFGEAAEGEQCHSNGWMAHSIHRPQVETDHQTCAGPLTTSHVPTQIRSDTGFTAVWV